MRARFRQILGTAAAFALALQTALWGIAPMAAALAIDPFSVICHSQASAPTDPATDRAPLSPTHACDHCNLCNASGPQLPPNTPLVGHFAPSRALHVLCPVDTAPRSDRVIHSSLARGPPAFA
jgi:hypothetical protein